MKQKTIYISIPITGTDTEAGRAKVAVLEEYFKNQGYNVINPFKIGDAVDLLFWCCNYDKAAWDDYMFYDINSIKNHATDIYMCSGWGNSKGCIKERNFAVELNLTIHYE